MIAKSRGFWVGGPWQEGQWAFSHNNRQYLVRKHHIDRYFQCFIELNTPDKPDTLDIDALHLKGEVSAIHTLLVSMSPKPWLGFKYYLPISIREEVHEEIHKIMNQIV